MDMISTVVWNEAKGACMADNTEQQRRYIDPVTGQPKDSSSVSTTEAGSEVEKESEAEKEKQDHNEKQGNTKPTTDAVDKPDRKGKGNLGGRHPGQTPKAAGDRDATKDRADVSIVEPMTSRAPDKVNQ
jgi:hypothetical protein